MKKRQTPRGGETPRSNRRRTGVRYLSRSELNARLRTPKLFTFRY